MRTEREAGRISAQVDTFVAASLLLGARAQRAFTNDRSPGGNLLQPVDAFAARIARTPLTGIA
ncbi:hypothetical protein [Streptomyces sp. NPDC001135]